MREKWQRHPQFSDYDISNLGRVRRMRAAQGTRPYLILKPILNKNGYFYVHLTSGNASKRCAIHVLVLEAFNGPRPEGYASRHLDSNRTNNYLSNLRWGTYAENYSDRVVLGRGNNGSNHGLSKLTDSQVAEIKFKYKEKITTQAKLAKEFGISRSHVCGILNGRSWKHIPGTLH